MKRQVSSTKGRVYNMTMMKVQTLKGFRDFLPLEARKRQYVINALKKVFEQYGFEQLETPVLEYDEILTGKYGDEGDQLMYRFEDQGKRKVAMRYDQTVPLARVVAQHQNELAFPFKRYQIQPVWRAENTQKGRYREFLQCDIDTVGVDSPLADAEIIATALAGYKELGFKNFKILLNDRKVFENLPTHAIITIDKLKKIGEEGVVKELVNKNLFESSDEAQKMLEELLKRKPTERINQIFAELEKLGVDQSFLEFSPTLARGLNYYTGMIFETETTDYPHGSLCSGGRYDELIGMFANKQIPAAGLAVGLDRTIEAMEALKLFPTDLSLSTTKVLVTIFSNELKSQSLNLCSQLRANNINAEIYLGEIKEKNPLEKQLKYADQKNIPYIIIVGPSEAEKNMVLLKDMKKRSQKELSVDDLLQTMQ